MLLHPDLIQGPQRVPPPQLGDLGSAAWRQVTHLLLLPTMIRSRLKSPLKANIRVVTIFHATKYRDIKT